MNTFALIPLAHIVASLTNPRKTFNQERLAELAESIRASGVHQPVLLRPLPGSRVADTAHHDPRPQYELVSGERRVRASAMAEQDSVPAMIRALSDDQVLDIQLVENLQREDLTPLEEAEGYDHLMHAHEPALSADDVAQRIGKSRAYVYARLKLLNLCHEGREALRLGQIDASLALLIARIPSTKVQADALGNVFNPMTGAAMSVREASALIQRQYMLRLPEARFNPSDAALVPSAGSCSHCSKRTGADPDIFADVKGADVCTDPPCFRTKTEAHQAQQLQAAADSGATVITGREAQELMPLQTDTRVEGYLRLDDARDTPTGGPKTIRELVGHLMEPAGIKPTLIENPNSPAHELIALVTRAEAGRLFDLAKAASGKGKGKAAGGQAGTATAPQEVDEGKAAAEAFERTWRQRVVAAAWENIRDREEGMYALPMGAITHLAKVQADALGVAQARALCDLLQLGSVAPKEAIDEWAISQKDPERALALLLMAEAASHLPGHPMADESRTLLTTIAADRGVGVDTGAIIEQAGEEAKAQLKAKQDAREAEQKSPDLPLSSAAQASGVRGGKGKAKKPGSAALAHRVPKTTEQEAIQGIAAAMQGLGEEGADAGPSGSDPDGASAVGPGGRATSPDASASELVPGARVRFVGVHMTGQLGRLKEAAGLEGKWLVNVDGLTSDYVFEPHEFQVVAEEGEAAC